MGQSKEAREGKYDKGPNRGAKPLRDNGAGADATPPALQGVGTSEGL